MSILDGGLLGSSGGGGGGGGGISNIVEDTTPQLGGVLDTQGNAVNWNGATQVFASISTHGALFRSSTSTEIIGYNVGNILMHKPIYAYNTTALGTTGGGEFTNGFLTGAMSFKSSSDPSTATDQAHIYSKDVSTSSEIFVQDEGGTATQISEHSRLAPDWMYDDEDEIIDRMGFEIQYFQGFVRFSNKTRIGLLASMTDAEKSARTTAQRQCVYQESFADYNTRTGENLVQLDWDTEQTRLQAEYDDKRSSIIAEIASEQDVVDNSNNEKVVESATTLIADLNGRLQEDKNIKKPKPSWLE